MKKSIKTLAIFILCIGCKSNAQIIDLYNSYHGRVSNAYYKDVDNKLNPYVGTWIFTNGNNSFTIKLEKRKMHYTASPVKYYDDVIIGEYKFIQDGNVQINTLLNFSNNNTSTFDFNLYGNILIPNNFSPQCVSCPDGSKRLQLEFNDPTHDAIFGPKASLILQRLVDTNGNQLLKATLVQTFPASSSVAPELSIFRVPYGEYILIKQ